MFVAIILIFFGSTCANEPEVRQNRIPPELFKAFEFLCRRVENGDLSIKAQTNLLSEFNQLITRSHSARSALELNKKSLDLESFEHRHIILNDMERINKYTMVNDPARVMLFVQNYRDTMLNGVYQEFEETELNLLYQHFLAVEFLVSTDVGNKYFQNVIRYVNAEWLKYPNQAFEYSSPTEYAFYIAMVGYYTYACLAYPIPANIVFCGLLTYYAIKAAGCPGGGSSNPACAGSTNPCCGILCSPGYACFNGECIDDPEYNPPACAEGCYWSVFECICP